MMEPCLEQGLYTLQVPLEAAAGAASRARGVPVLLFSSYSYLGLIGHPRIAKAVEAAVARYGTSAGGVRLLTGTLDLHRELEERLARFLGVEACATFGSGYDANLAVMASLFGPRDVALLDEHAHRSLHDGARMAGCRVRRFRHNDLEDLDRRLAAERRRGVSRLLVVVDGVYSMDGDQAPLEGLLEVKRRHGAFLLVDEAHSFGAVGATGRGACEAQGVDPGEIDLITGSLSKAIPSSGGFVAGSRELQIFLQHTSSPYIFSAALTPPNAAAALEAVEILQQEPEHLVRLRENTAFLSAGLARLGLFPGPAASPVLPVRLGDEWRALRWARQLMGGNLLASAVIAPAVAPGQARLRICATASHRTEHLRALLEGLAACQAMEEG